jgi:hypothetical protein
MQVINSNVIKQNNLYSEDSDLQPFEQLLKHLKQFEYYPVSESLKMDIQRLVDRFLQELMFCKRVLLNDEPKISVCINNSFEISPNNLITACLLFGYYVTSFILSNQNKVIIPDVGEVKYDYDENRYVLIKHFK